MPLDKRKPPGRLRGLSGDDVETAGVDVPRVLLQPLKKQPRPIGPGELAVIAARRRLGRYLRVIEGGLP